jgi:hypothetical protein
MKELSTTLFTLKIKKTKISCVKLIFIYYVLGCPESSERFCGTYSVSRYKINVKSIGNFC